MSDHTQSDDADKIGPQHVRRFVRLNCEYNEQALHVAFVNSWQRRLRSPDLENLTKDAENSLGFANVYAEETSEIFVKTIDKQLSVAIYGAFVEAEIASFEKLVDAWVSDGRLTLGEARDLIAKMRAEHEKGYAKLKRQLWGATRKRAPRVTQGSLINALLKHKHEWDAPREAIAESLGVDVRSVDNFRIRHGYATWAELIADLKKQIEGS